jgi:hypothetical protein
VMVIVASGACRDTVSEQRGQTGYWLTRDRDPSTEEYLIWPKGKKNLKLLEYDVGASSTCTVM